MFWTLATIVAVAANYAAARYGRLPLGRLVLWGTILPAFALVAVSAYRLLYAIVNAEEVNARFAAGDLTYFGADMAFPISLVLAGLWTGLAYAGFRAGRSGRIP